MPRVDAPTTPATATLPISRLRFIELLLRNQLKEGKIDAPAPRAFRSVRVPTHSRLPRPTARVVPVGAQKEPPLAGRPVSSYAVRWAATACQSGVWMTQSGTSRREDRIDTGAETTSRIAR